jgi:alkylation response protein AidB-like acyl-CoA dehydrogenase
MSEQSPAAVDVEQLVGDWVDANWHLDLTVGQWWQLLADSGYCHPSLPVEAGGRGWSQGQAMTAMRTLAQKGVIGPPPGLGYMLAAPTLAAHGTPEQIGRYLPKILNGEEAWCQLFSEPGAGSDLAGLQTKGERDGEEWSFTGQKVWTSQGNLADLGMLVARTDPDQPKHLGMSYFALVMDQPGIEVRPLREMTGRSFFSEVFMDGARATTADMIGGRGDGWRVANTTLAHERASIGSGSAGYVIVNPGSRADNLGRRVGDVIERRSSGKGGHAPGVGLRLWDRYRDLAQDLGRSSDPVLRQRFIELNEMLQVNRIGVQRSKDKLQRTGAEPNIGKLFDAEIHRRFRELGLTTIGADGMLASESSTTDPSIAETALYASAPSIYGGTDQIQRNIVAERVLGLPKEPGPGKETPFSELPKNQ